MSLTIPKDKIGHLIAGCVLAFIGGLAWYMLSQLGVVQAHGWRAASAFVGCTGGAIKEYCDWQDNKIHPGMHGVEFLDFLATSTAGLLLVASMAFV